MATNLGNGFHTLPVSDIPASPPSYEEAIQTPAPEFTSIETLANDEPPPSYTEATRDDVHPTNSLSSETNDPQNTSDLAGLIIASIVRRELQNRYGRRPDAASQSSSSSSRIQANRLRSREPSQPKPTFKKFWLCLIGAFVGVVLVAAMVSVSVLQQTGYNSQSSSSSSTSDDNYHVNIPDIPDLNNYNLPDNFPKDFIVPTPLTNWLPPKNTFNRDDLWNSFQITQRPFAGRISTPNPFRVNINHVLGAHSNMQTETQSFKDAIESLKSSYRNDKS